LAINRSDGFSAAAVTVTTACLSPATGAGNNSYRGTWPMPCSTAVSRTLARLEKLGLVSRASSAYDRRIKTASVTPEGHRVVEAINQGRRRLLDEALAGWSQQDRAALTRLTRRSSDRMLALMEALDQPAQQAADPEPADHPA
jgi:DNA-binding PadR family transcriptional regulator